MTTPTPAPAPMTAERLDQCAWLIECRIGPESTYIQLKSREELSQEWEEEIHARGYDAAKKLKPWHFTKDASSATRFAREEDAARAMVALGMQGPTGLLDWLRPTEHMWSDAAHPDVSNVPALTARVAELERERARWEHLAMEAWRRGDAAYTESLKDNLARVKLESKLAAARKVEDGEVATMVKSLRYLAQDDVADLLTRLSAALKEAERRAERAEKMHAEAFRIGIQHQEAAQAAEAKLETARRDALEEAAKVCDTISFVKTTPQKQIGARMCAAKLRALQTKDTTP